MRRLLLSLPALALASTVPAAAQSAGANWDNTDIPVLTCSAPDRILGWEFTPTGDLAVTELGAYDSWGFSLSGTQSGLRAPHQVSLFNAQGDRLRSILLPVGAASPGPNEYVYAPIDPIVLLAGENYSVIATWPQGPFDKHIPPFTNSPTITFHADLDFVQSRIALGTLDLILPANTENTFRGVYVANFVISHEIASHYCGPAQPNSSGLAAIASAVGSDVVATNHVQLVAYQLPVNQFGYFLNSQVQGSIPFPTASQGVLCLGGPVGRYANQVGFTDAIGQFSIELELPNTPTPTGPVQILAGETWFFQAWYRDVNPTTTSNFTDGVRITFL